jgi:predicted amidohydrolase YtcJ
VANLLLSAGPADLVVRGRIATLRHDAGWGWAEALAVTGGRVVGLGSWSEVAVCVGRRTRVVELAPDEVLLPGLTDAHCHLVDAALAAAALDLRSAASLAEGLAAVTEHHRRLPPGCWLLGRGWAVHRWGAWPTAHDLDRAAPNRPVAIWSQDHHAIWASSMALAAAGIGPEDPDPPGGRLLRGADGRPTGILLERAAGLVAAAIPEPPADETAELVAAFVPQLLELGLVGVQDPGPLGPDPTLGRLAVYARLDEAGRLPVRVEASVRLEALDAALAAGLRSGAPLGPTGRARFGWLKCFADGALGSRTAALLEPYAVPVVGPERGIWQTAPAELAEAAERASRAGIAVQIHAIGDAAVRAALDALARTVGRTAAAPRIEHVQLVDPADLPRFGRMGIVASVQPAHLVTDAEPALVAWGARARRSGYPWRSLAAGGALLAFGSDAPVESVDPWPGVEVAVTRRAPERPTDVLLGEAEGLDLEAAIRSATTGGPRSAGASERGRLGLGAPADAIVVPAVALEEPVEPGGPLGTVRPRLVLVDGAVVFER